MREGVGGRFLAALGETIMSDVATQEEIELMVEWFGDHLGFEDDMSREEREALDIERQMFVSRMGWNEMSIEQLEEQVRLSPTKRELPACPLKRIIKEKDQEIEKLKEKINQLETPPKPTCYCCGKPATQECSYGRCEGSICDDCCEDGLCLPCAKN